VPDLPDLKLKVRTEDSSLDATEAKLKAFGLAADTHLAPAGQAFARFGASGELASLRITSSTAKSRSDLEALGTRATAFGEGLDKDMRKGLSGVITLGEDGSAALGRVTQNLDVAGQAATQATGGMAAGFAKLGPIAAGAGAAVIPVLIGIGAAAALALAPVIAFGVGLSGALTVMATGLGIIGGLGAVIVLLATHYATTTQASQNLAAAQAGLSTATNAHTIAVKELDTFLANTKGHRLSAIQWQLLGDLQKNVTDTTYKLAVAQNSLAASTGATASPVAKLSQHFGEMADRLGQRALPAANAIGGFLDRLIPSVEKVGGALIDAFSGRQVFLLDIMGKIAESLFGTFDKLGPVIGKFLGAFIDRAPQMQALFGEVLSFGVGAITGLLTNLLRLSDWFFTNLPTIRPVAAAVFNDLGRLAMWLADTAFPAIVAAGANLDRIIRQVIDAFQKAWPTISQVAGLLAASLGPALQVVSQHSDWLKVALLAVGVVLGTVVVAAAAVVAAAVVLVAILEKVFDASGWLEGRMRDLADIIKGAVGDAFSALGGFVNGLLADIQNVVTWIGNLADAIRHLPSIPGVAGVQAAVSAVTSIPHAGGGPVLPGNVYTVGEAGPETLVVGQSGGYVIPHGQARSAGGTISDGTPISAVLANDQQSQMVSLLQAQNALLARIDASLRSTPPFSNRAYGA